MPRIDFDDLPDSARVWIFPADRPLEPRERRELLDAVDEFLEDWNAHGAPLRGARDLRYARFLIVGVDEEAAPPSGCSIDALVRVFKEKERELDLRLLDRSPVWYREDPKGGSAPPIRCVSRSEFRDLADAGAVAPDTVVFDPAVTRMDRIRGGDWEGPAHASWHGALITND